MRKDIRLGVLIGTAVFLYGCALAWFGVGAGIGAGTYRYIQGNVERDYRLSFDSAWEITNDALANRYISVTDSLNEGIKGTIEALQRDGKKVTIKLHEKGPKLTTITIRVGLLGSIKDAESIHEEIKNKAGLE